MATQEENFYELNYSGATTNWSRSGAQIIQKKIRKSFYVYKLYNAGALCISRSRWIQNVWQEPSQQHELLKNLTAKETETDRTEVSQCFKLTGESITKKTTKIQVRRRSRCCDPSPHIRRKQRNNHAATLQKWSIKIVKI